MNNYNQVLRQYDMSIGPRPATNLQPLPADQAIAELRKAANSTKEEIFNATTVFPFTLVPDTVIIDREKLTIAHRMFFRVAEVISIRIEDILNVTADVGPFFGSIKLSTRFFDPGKPYTVDFLWRGDALKIKRILQGFVIATQKQIDCSQLSTQQLAKLLDDIGQGSPSKDM